MKLYFKKLLWAVIFVAMIFVIYFVGFNILFTAANFFKNSTVWNLILFGIPFLGGLIFIFKARVGNRINRTQYMNSLNDIEFSFKKDLIRTVRSKDFITEVLALLTISCPFFCAVGLSENTSIPALILGIVLLTLISVSVFSITDITIWLLVHRKWVKGE
ncbi:MAG: hypothetical protein E7525_02105 [Ruminococcaceae bacterium]|nr:hypothetical protein [Oscillospiraceae bacterium]